MSPLGRACATSLLVVLPALAVAAPPSAEQRGCILTVAARTAALAAAQARQVTACAGAAAGAIDPACIAADLNGAIARETRSLRAAVIEHCREAPAFGTDPRPVPVATAAGTVHVRGLATDLLGDGTVPAGLTGPDGPRCRRAVARGAGRLLTRVLKRTLACQRAALRRDATDAAPLAACVAADLGGNAMRTASKLRSRIARACTSLAAPVAGVLAERVRARVACRACRLANAAGGLDADCETVDDGAANDSCRMRVTLRGDVLPFHLVPDGRLAGATISILEHPERQVVTGADGHFEFDDLEEGGEVTLVLSHPDYHPIQNGTMRLGPAGADLVTFQAVITPIYQALAALLGITPDEEHACQMVTTFTRFGKTMYDPGAHGEAGALAHLTPSLPPEHGPIYFNSSVLPDPVLTESSDDGGVLFVQVPPGEYVWTATKPGTAFSRVKMKCRPGFLVNASPPWGLQVQ
jgi:hypothetical protein